MQDYWRCIRTQKQGQTIYLIERNWYVLEILKYSLVTWGICYIWFDSIWGMICALPFSVFCYRVDKKRYFEKMVRRTRVEFKDFLVLLSGNLTAGYALEGAFLQTYKDIQKQYGNDFLIKSGIEKCVNGVQINQGIELLFEDFSTSVGIAEIADCARLLSLSKRYGGNMISMLKRVADNISSVLSVEQEIETMEAQKKLEGKIMLLAPFGIVAYMRLTNPGYLDFMYETTVGHLIMGIMLAIIVAVGIWMNKILTIE